MVLAGEKPEVRKHVDDSRPLDQSDSIKRSSEDLVPCLSLFASREQIMMMFTILSGEIDHRRLCGRFFIHD